MEPGPDLEGVITDPLQLVLEEGVLTLLEACCTRSFTVGDEFLNSGMTTSLVSACPMFEHLMLFT